MSKRCDDYIYEEQDGKTNMYITKEEARAIAKSNDSIASIMSTIRTAAKAGEYSIDLVLTAFEADELRRAGFHLLHHYTDLYTVSWDY